MNKRIQKRWKRENRPNKGVNTEAARQAYNEQLRAARQRVGLIPGDIDSRLLLDFVALAGLRK